MVLLDLVCRVAPVLELRPGVIHVDHGLRGDASHGDACFVEEQCRMRSLPFHLARLGMDPRMANLEEHARIRRYEAFFECMEHSGYDCSATGHTLDDQAETVLYRVIRGTGTRGLGGMTYRRKGGIIRPMLRMTRAMVESYASQRRLIYVQDASNESMNHARNLIRHSVMPLMRRINPRAAYALSSLASIAQEEGSVLETMAVEISRRALVFDWRMIRGFRLDDLEAIPDAVLRRFLIRTITGMIDEVRGMDAAQVEMAMRVVSGEAAAHSIRRRIRVCRDGRMLVFHLLQGSEPYMHHIERTGDFFVPELGMNIHIGFAGDAPGTLVLRSWQPGDRMNGRRVVDVLSSRKVPVSLRPFWPVLVSKDRVAAVARTKGDSVFSELRMDPEHGT